MEAIISSVHSSDQVVVLQNMLEHLSFDARELGLALRHLQQSLEIEARLLLLEPVDLEVAQDHSGNVTHKHVVILLHLHLLYVSLHLLLILFNVSLYEGLEEPLLSCHEFAVLDIQILLFLFKVL